MNLLQHETSPYLRQHADNPVAWIPWGDAAFQRARAENKPILLSVGYAACHWCHVMAHESFEDIAIAEVMNQRYINIKVDREEFPDVDAFYQSALSLMGQQGGWPLTMFLTPAGEPFYGGTYFPPTPRYGRASFLEVLETVAKVYQTEPDKVGHNVKALLRGLEDVQSSIAGQVAKRSQLDAVAADYTALVDPLHGGIGTEPKFPNLPQLRYLWQSYRRQNKAEYKSAVIQSLVQMCQGGIYDHVGGGFARYSVDREWLVPHFEKMLYDNAQFIQLLSEVYQETQHPLFADRVRETVTWIFRELSVRNESYTAYAAALDADSEGVEGKYYVWRAAEVESILGNDSSLFKQYYDIAQGGNWEGVSILNRLQHPDYVTAVQEKKFRTALDDLAAARDQRIPPARDHKVLTDINGLLITALTTAAFVFNEPDWQLRAENAYRFILKNMQQDGQLKHSWCDGKAQDHVILDDYAGMIAAALKLYEATRDHTYLQQAENWAAIVLQDYTDPAGGFFMTAAGDGMLPLRPKSASDSAIPSGNGMMAQNLQRLCAMTGNGDYYHAAENILKAYAGDMTAHYFSYATLWAAADFYLQSAHLIIVGDDTAGFDQALRSIYAPNVIVMRLLPQAILPDGHPAEGKTMVDGKTTAYICVGQRCLAPLTDPAALKQVLFDLTASPAANDA